MMVFVVVVVIVIEFGFAADGMSRMRAMASIHSTASREARKRVVASETKGVAICIGGGR